MNQTDMLARLTSLADEEFVELFYEVVRKRDPVGGENNRHFVLAETSQCPDEDRDTVFVALPAPERYPEGWVNDAPICQTGECGECGSWVSSIAKHAICPICEAEVYCT